MDTLKLQSFFYGQSLLSVSQNNVHNHIIIPKKLLILGLHAVTCKAAWCKKQRVAKHIRDLRKLIIFIFLAPVPKQKN